MFKFLEKYKRVESIKYMQQRHKNPTDITHGAHSKKLATTDDFFQWKWFNIHCTEGSKRGMGKTGFCTRDWTDKIFCSSSVVISLCSVRIPDTC